jgi:DNA topoisomerase-1
MPHLFIVESPGKTKKIASFLGTGFTVKASFGHIRDLPPKDMGVDIDHGFKPTYVVIDNKAGKSKRSIISELKAQAAKADSIYLATDDDREGESIAWHLFVALGLKRLGKPVHRVRFNAITRPAIEKAMANLGTLDIPLVSAQECRRVLDRLVGWMVSPRLRHLGRGFSAGRVQSPAVRLVVERELEIRNFQPVTHYTVEAHMNQPFPWKASWDHAPYREKGQTLWLDQTVAEAVAKVTRLTVLSVEKSRRERRPPPPFITSTLQQAASVALRLSPEKTMGLAQKLYEQGLITYMRTDNPNLSEEGLQDIAAYLQANHLPAATRPNTWKTKDSAQGAHEAIRPTHAADRAGGESKEEQALYHLIWQRAVASQMANAAFDVTDVRLEGNVAVPLGGHKPALFIAKGETVTSKGWMALTQAHEDHENKREEPAQALPTLKAGDAFDCKGVCIAKQTTPPSRYTEASLVKKLEDLGIGRPSSYATIVGNLKSPVRHYVTLNAKRQLEPTERGFAVVNELVGKQFSFLEYDYTKHLEAGLDQVAVGNKTYQALLTEAWAVLQAELARMGLNGNRSAASVPNGTLEHQNKTESAYGESHCKHQTVAAARCRCGGPIAKSPKAWSCTDCKAIVWNTIASKPIDEQTALALLAGEQVKVDGLKSKAGKLFSAYLYMDEDGKVKFGFS